MVLFACGHFGLQTWSVPSDLLLPLWAQPLSTAGLGDLEPFAVLLLREWADLLLGYGSECLERERLMGCGLGCSSLWYHEDGLQHIHALHWSKTCLR